MSYGNGLSFRTLSEYNRDRVGYFGHGELEDWNVAEWSNAIAGEAGELCNLTKKIVRGDFTEEQSKQEIADELADVVAYCDLLAQRQGIDLGVAVREKFNRVSKRVDYKGIMRPE